MEVKIDVQHDFSYLIVVIDGLCEAGSFSYLWWTGKAIKQGVCLYFGIKPCSGAPSILSAIPRRLFLVPSVTVRRTSWGWKNGADLSGKKGSRTCWQRHLFLLADSYTFIWRSSLTGTLLEGTILLLLLL